jgi:hypothetical protein
VADRLTPEERARLQRRYAHASQKRDAGVKLQSVYVLDILALLASEADLRAELARLQEALSEYGEHLIGCSESNSYRPAGSSFVCTCGYSEALSGAPQRKDGTT